MAIAFTLVGLFGGCGGADKDAAVSDERAAGQAAVRLANAMGAEDAETSCNLLSESAKAKLVDDTTAQCTEVLPRVSTVEDEQVLSSFGEADIERTQIDGSRAQVRFVDTTLPTVLRKVDGRWLVDELAVPGFKGSVANPDGSPIKDTTPALTPVEVRLKTTSLAMGLRGAGFEVRNTAGGGPGTGELDVAADGGRNAEIRIHVLPSANEAAKLEQELIPRERRSPGRIELGLYESVLIVVLAEDPASLPADQFARLRDLVVAFVSG